LLLKDRSPHHYWRAVTAAATYKVAKNRWAAARRAGHKVLG